LDQKQTKISILSLEHSNYSYWKGIGGGLFGGGGLSRVDKGGEGGKGNSHVYILYMFVCPIDYFPSFPCLKTLAPLLCFPSCMFIPLLANCPSLFHRTAFDARHTLLNQCLTLLPTGNQNTFSFFSSSKLQQTLHPRHWPL